MSVTNVALAELLEDWALYPRHDLDEQHVANLIQALKAGEVLPPIVADQSSRRIVDGWHRARAYRQLLGPDAVVSVDLREYPNEDAMLLAAIEFNSRHGRKLDRMDQTRSVVMCEERGLSRTVIAAALHIPVERVERLRVHVATAPAPSGATVSGTQKVVLKRSNQWLDGMTLTEEQAQATVSAPGVSYLLLARQLTEGLRAGIVNLGDERLLAALHELRDVLADLPAAA